MLAARAPSSPGSSPGGAPSARSFGSSAVGFSFTPRRRRGVPLGFRLARAGMRAICHGGRRQASVDGARRLSYKSSEKEGASQMPRMVKCVKLDRELPGIVYKPFDNELGKRIYENVSQEA